MRHYFNTLFQVSINSPQATRFTLLRIFQHCLLKSWVTNYAASQFRNDFIDFTQPSLSQSADSFTKLNFELLKLDFNVTDNSGILSGFIDNEHSGKSLVYFSLFGRFQNNSCPIYNFFALISTIVYWIKFISCFSGLHDVQSKKLTYACNVPFVIATKEAKKIDTYWISKGIKLCLFMTLIHLDNVWDNAQD